MGMFCPERVDIMKKIKFVIFPFLIALLIASASGCKKDPLAFQMSGVQLSVADFRALYAGEKQLADCDSRKDATGGISNVELADSYLSFYMMTSCNKNIEICNFMGQLLRDQTLTDAGVPAAVAYIVDTSGALQPLLFQIYQSDTPDDTLLFHPELSGKPHLKVYMIDKKENMYFFELELPEVFSTLDLSNLPTTNAYDHWYQTFFEDGGVENEG